MAPKLPSVQPRKDERQQGGMMNCPMMQGQMAQGAMANCMQGQAQGGPAMMHGRGMMKGAVQSGEAPAGQPPGDAGNDQTNAACCQPPTKSH